MCGVSVRKLTGGGEDSQFTAVSKTRVHPHDGTTSDWTRQQPLPQVPHEHDDGFFLCCHRQLGPEQTAIEMVKKWQEVGVRSQTAEQEVDVHFMVGGLERMQSYGQINDILKKKKKNHL